MKFSISILFISISVIISGCKTSQTNTDSQLNLQTELATNIDSVRYSFVADMAIPQGGRSIPLSGITYSLKVSPDTIEAHLPYFGRAYIAPNPTDDGGVNFISTNFDYIMKTSKDSWTINIAIKDIPNRPQLTLQIWNNGNATLLIRDNYRQSISYYGNVNK